MVWKRENEQKKKFGRIREKGVNDQSSLGIRRTVINLIATVAAAIRVLSEHQAEEIRNETSRI